MIERTYFPLWYRLGNRDRYIIWISESRTDEEGDHDGVFVAPDGRVPSFLSAEELRLFAQAQELAPLSDEAPLLHNLDIVARWLGSKSRTRSDGVDYNAFLAAWNLFADLARSLGGGFNPDGGSTSIIYGKLFWGNMNWMAPPGEEFFPYWRGREIRLMHRVLGDGLKLFRQSVRRAR